MVLDWFWARLGIILGGHFGYLFGLCEKGLTLRKCYKQQSNRRWGASENDQKASQTRQEKRYESEDEHKLNFH